MGAMRGFAPILLFLLVLGGVNPARAQSIGGLPSNDRSFDVQLLHPAVGPNGFITLDSAEVPEHGLVNIGLLGNYQYGPFSLESRVGETTSRLDIVRHQGSYELYGAMGLANRFELGLGLPMTLRLEGDDYTTTGQARGSLFQTAGIGDLRIEGKAELVDFGTEQAFLIGLSAGVTLPTGDESSFLGDKGPTGQLRALLEWQATDRVRTLLMAGALLRRKSAAFRIEIGSQALFGAALDYRVLRDMSLLAEVSGRAGSRYVDANPAELDLALRAHLPQRFQLLLGGGFGLNGGVGSPLARAFVGVGWAPDFRDRDHDGLYDHEDLCPDEPEDRDGTRDEDGCPDPDNDGDGIPDAQDKCPTQGEDFDGYEDEDGCPEVDNDNDGIPDLHDACPNAKEDGKGKRPADGCASTSEDSDGDGIPDVRDKCPEEPEDFDGFEDEDGCPDFDNDNDGIPDQYDTCPNEAEDLDGFEDTDGCMDVDNDRDGIVDGKDRCPNQPETLNGTRDDDGCPDSAPVLVELEVDDNRIELHERITFLPGTPFLSPMGITMVKLVAMVMRGHPELAMVRIEVRGQGVSQVTTRLRAEAVALELTAHGIDPRRLKPVGMGKGSGRVDFIIERVEARKTAPPPSPGNPAEPGMAPMEQP